MNTLTISGPALLPSGEISDATLRIAGGVITQITAGLDPSADLFTDGIIAPGLIDIQINGAWGNDFTTDGRSVAQVSQQLPSTGVTAFMPTIITAPFESYAPRLAEISTAAKIATGAHVLGVHLEGPYISPERPGAHNPALVRPIDIRELMHWADHPLIRMITIAPELPGALDAARRLRARGILVSAGHSNATLEAAQAGISAGFGAGTHLFNAMREMYHREPGLTGALLDTPIICGMIADGIHVHPIMLRLAMRAKGSQGLALITDAIAAMGMPPGNYHLGDRDVTVETNAVRLSNGTLAGSILTLDQAVRIMVAFGGCTPAEALTMASTTPARLLGLRAKGRLANGCDADIVMLDRSLNITHTLLGGRIAFTAQAAQLYI